MVGFKIFFLSLLAIGVASASIDTRQEAILPEEMGVWIASETNYFDKDGISVSKKIVMKKGKKIRIDETTPMPVNNLPEWYEELKTVTISDDKTAWVLTPCKSETLKPITDLLEYLGFRYPIENEEETEETSTKIIQKSTRKLLVDMENHCVLKEERGKEEIFYKNHELIEGVGFLPKTIERYSNGELRAKTLVKRIDMFREFSNALFEPQQITFSERAKRAEEKLEALSE